MIVLAPAWLLAPLLSPRLDIETTIVAFAMTDGLTQRQAHRQQFCRGAWADRNTNHFDFIDPRRE